MMSTQKSCKEIVFYCSPNRTKTYNGKTVYESWPKLPHHDDSGAKYWAKGWNSTQKSFTVTMDNSFKDAIVFDDVDSRGQSAKVPSAIVYNKEHDCYLKFDFRTDGLVDLLTNGTVSKGKIGSEMAFRYAGSNYFFVRKQSQAFKDFEQTFTPKGKKKTSSKVDVGVPFIGAFESVYVYLGKFKCTEDQDEGVYTPSYKDQNVHVYQQVGYYNYRGDATLSDDSVDLIINKSKMNVKKVIDTNDKDYNDFANVTVTDMYVETKYITKGSYGVSVDWEHEGKLVLDRNTNEARITKVKRNRNSGMCGGHPLGSFGMGSLFK